VFRKIAIILLAAVMAASVLPACSLSLTPASGADNPAPTIQEAVVKPAKKYEAVALDMNNSKVLLAPGETYFPGLLRVSFKNDQDNALLAILYDVYGRNVYYNNDRKAEAKTLSKLPHISFVLESANPDVAFYEGNRVVGVSEGETVLTIRLVRETQSEVEPGFMDMPVSEAIFVEIAITVAVPITSLSVAEEIIELVVEETAWIEPHIKPIDASSVLLAYESRDESIATVDGNGEIKALAQGETAIIITATDSIFEKKYTAEVLVIVKDPPPTSTYQYPNYGGNSSSGGSSGGSSGSSGSSGSGLSGAQQAEAYAIAAAIVGRHMGESEAVFLASIAREVNAYYNLCRYTTDRDNDPYYDTAYGVFIAKTASCAGAVRAVNLCLSIAGYSYEHVNEWQYSHQWSRVYVASLEQYWVVDGGITGGWGLAAPEPAPYKHPWLG